MSSRHTLLRWLAQISTWTMIWSLPGSSISRELDEKCGVYQVTTLDRAKLTKRIGALPVDLVREVDRGLRAAMDLD